MKKLKKVNRLLVGMFLSMWFVPSCAQIPVELSIGHSSYYYQHSFAAKFKPEKPFGFFHTSSVMIPYHKNRGNEIMSQSYFTYTLSKRWASGMGSIFTPVNRVRPSAFVQYFNKWKSTSLMFFPRIDIWSDPNLELMGFIEYQGDVSRPMNLYARFQFMSVWNRNGHARSAQYARLGMDTAGLQFGLAANFDQYGPMATHYNNFGLFVRRVF